ncbi:MAG: low molecular weight protein arginine phosphatase [Peptostreptococcaceae bacterium]|jgi:protein-tyrosine phosphatase|nr:low molecular weight protein arginine phosphatase [Peptostreptococcaceae bacterium]
MNILFLCTGNTCRSPIAEFLLKDLIQKEGLEDKVNVSSAGLATANGLEISKYSLLALKERKIDAKAHKSIMVTKEDLLNSDLILTMTIAHKEKIINFDMSLKNKIYTLKEYLNRKDLDIKDPFLKDFEVYKSTRDEIEKLIIELFEKIKNNL